MSLSRVSFPAVALLCFSLPAGGQSVVCTHAGLVHYFEGAVSIAGTPLQPQFGRFPEIPQGAELRTAEGRAEVLLGPGAIIRVAEDSAIKLLSSSLTDARLEMLSGAAVMEFKDAPSGNSVTLLHENWQIRIPKRGVYRIDTSPQQLRVYDGEVEVRAAEESPVTVKAGQTLPLAAVLVPEETLGPPGDAFNSWTFARTEAVAADNATAAQIVDDPALYPNLGDLSGLALAGYTYFPPMIGAPYMISGTYGAWTPYVGAYYGYGLGLGYTVSPLYPRLPGAIGSPLPHLPAGGYYPIRTLPPTYRGIAAPSFPRPVIPPHVPVHGGHR